MTISTQIKKGLNPIRSWMLNDLRTLAEDNLLLQGRAASWRVRAMETISTLQDVEFKVFSQWGEDGIIDWLIERAGIPPAAQSFVEFGVESYREANTRFLLQNRNWRGLILDGGSEMNAAIKADGLAWKYDLTGNVAFITRENINQLLSSSGFTGEIGLLSIDLDGNDFWVWQAIDVVQPILCICEYNAVFGDLHPVSTPYDPQFQRTNAHFSNLFCGASIQALRSLATSKGYHFLGTTSAANDAFFVREDYAAKFTHAIRTVNALPSRARGSSDASGQLSYAGGLDRLKLIESCSVVNTHTGERSSLADLAPIYSNDWLSQMTGSKP